ncbi:hypothetical protein GCM10010301_08320 [Streptomyces plicatus]|nr:hypothetical protein GCM10010301_08320 [Streptomyces plicatus]
MTGGERVSGETEGDVVRLRKRDVVGLLGCLVVGGAVLVFAIGGTRWYSRHIAPVVYDVPGGSWTVGAGLGLLSLVGWAGLLADWFGDAVGTSGASRAADVVARVGCGAAAVAPIVFLVSGLQGRNCRSYEPGCAYISGTGPAVLVYVAVTGGLGWLFYRRRRAVLDERRARERDRLRKLRKKGKGKSRRAAAGR